MHDTFRIFIPDPPTEQLHGNVYQIKNTVNGKLYIGKATKTRHRGSRWKEHVGLALRGSNVCPHFYRAIRKHGSSAFKNEVIAQASSKEQLSDLEKLFIAAYQTRDSRFGYNIALGGEGGAGHWGKKHSLETRAKVSASLRGKKHSPETRAKMSQQRKGKKMPPEAVAKTAAFHRGRPSPLRGRKLTDEQRAKLSAAMRDKKKSPEHIEKIAACNRGRVAWNRGKPFSAEVRAKMSLAKRHASKQKSPAVP